jgi:hypothetical protein
MHILCTSCAHICVHFVLIRLYNLVLVSLLVANYLALGKI